MTIQELREKLISNQADQKDLLDGKTKWDNTAFQTLQSTEKDLNEKLEVLLKAAAGTQQTAPVDPVTKVPIPTIPQPAQTSPGATSTGGVTGIGQNGEIVPGWYNDPNKGYKGAFVAGQVLVDQIKGNIYGPDVVSKEFGQYCSYLTGLEQTAGITTTLTNGIEIVPEMLTGIKEQAGARLMGLDLMIVESSAKGVIEYLKDEKTYQVGGLIASFTKEGAKLDTTRDEVDEGLLKLDALTVFSALTEEIMQDAPLLESRYIAKAPQVMRIKWWETILAGSGVNEPQGILGGGSTVTVTRSGASLIAFADLVNMEARYLAAGLSMGFYVVNQTGLPQLMTMSDTSGALIWKSSRNDGTTQNPIQGSLFGRPVIVSEDAETLGTSGDITLINPAGYLAVQQARGIAFATSPHFFFDTREMALRWDTRVGGMPYFKEAYTPRKGNLKLSNFVNLSTSV